MRRPSLAIFIVNAIFHRHLIGLYGHQPSNPPTSHRQLLYYSFVASLTPSFWLGASSFTVALLPISRSLEIIGTRHDIISALNCIHFAIATIIIFHFPNNYYCYYYYFYYSYYCFIYAVVFLQLLLSTLLVFSACLIANGTKLQLYKFLQLQFA